MFNFLKKTDTVKIANKFLEELFCSQSKRMWLVSVDILKDRSLAEDAVQAAFIKLIKKVDLLMSFNNEFKVSAYVYSVTKNTALAILKKSKGHEFVNLVNCEDIPDTEYDVEEIIVRVDEVKFVYKNILSLKPKYQDVLYLRYFLDLSYPEVAELLGITIDNARKRVQIGIKTLKSMMERGASDEE